MSERTPGLHELTAVLSARMSIRQAAQAIVDHASMAFSAEGAYLERCVPLGRADPGGTSNGEGPAREVEVLAAVGVGVPRAGFRVPDPGSLTPTSAATGDPETVTFPDEVGEPMAARLACWESGAGRPCPGMIVPLMAEGRPQGALVLHRSACDQPFTNDDLARARPLGDVATGALRRISLIEALSESEGRLRQVAEHLREFIWLSDTAFTTHYYVNSAYEEIWGRSKASLYADARSLLDGVHHDDRERVRDALFGMHAGEYDIEFRVVRPDGAVRWVWSRGFPVRRDDGSVYRIAGITEDITDRKLAAIERDRLLEREREARLASEKARAIAEQRRKELERVTESRTRLIRGFTHDVKNPLGAADGFLALQLEGIHGALTESQRANLERARRSIRSALDLVHHTLEIARAEAGELEIQSRPTDVSALVAQTGEEFRAEAEAKGLSVSVGLPSELPLTVSDPPRILQVLANLVSNAVKYTPSGGRITLSVRVASREGGPGENRWIAVDVTDTGKGIPADQRRLLFREFTRFDPAAAQGAGIGLAISQRLAEALGGLISVESEVGVGSTFTLWLPLREPRQADPPG